jgi:protein-S-isoprenylcysteine O-methyltransferase Ste14
MNLTRVLLLSAAGSTWTVFAVCMGYFRHARKTNSAKTWLTCSAFLCTLVEGVALVQSAASGPLLAWGGIACFAAAQGLFWWSLATHGRRRPAFAFVPVAPAHFVQAGPYRLVRHPIYTAYLLAWFAGAVAAGQPWLLLTVALMGGIYYRAARQEERSFLAGPFASQYREYQGRTGMFIPRLS